MTHNIKINGADYPIFFGMNALRKIFAELGIYFNYMSRLANMVLDESFLIIHIGLQEGARRSNKDFALSFDEVCDLFDDDMNGFTMVTKAIEIFTDSLPMQEEGNAKAPKAKAKAQA